MKQTEAKVSKGGICLDAPTIDHIKMTMDPNSEAKKAVMVEGEVVEISPSCWGELLDPTPRCEIGDTILVPRFCGQAITINETKALYRLIRPEDVLAVIEEAD